MRFTNSLSGPRVSIVVSSFLLIPILVNIGSVLARQLLTVTRKGIQSLLHYQTLSNKHWGYTFDSMVNMGSIPRFDSCVLAPERESGYWASFVDVNGSGHSDTLAFGVRAGPIEIFHNPYAFKSERDDVRKSDEDNNLSKETRSLPKWRSTKLDSPEGPVAAATAALTGDYADIVIATRFGGGLPSIDDDGGQLILYVNPRNEGRSWDAPWDKFEIGRLAGTHRINFGYFTTTEEIQLLAVPITSKQGDPFAPVDLTLLKPTSKNAVKNSWSTQPVSNHTYSVVHDIFVGRYRKDDHLDSILVASNEGLTWVYYDSGEWKRDIICGGLDLNSTGHMRVGPESDVFSGYQNVAVGKIGDDSCAFIAVSASFHGNVVRILVKTSGTRDALTGAKWKAFTLHTFDTDSPIVDGSGGVHQVATVDIDGDGDDEVLIAHKSKGVYMARVAAIADGVWQISSLSTSPATRLDVADIDRNGLLDIVTLGDTIDTDEEQKPAKLLVLKNLGCR